MKIFNKWSRILLLAIFCTIMVDVQQLYAMEGASSTTVTIDEQELPECPICYELYDNQNRILLKMLCKHELCLMCAQGILKKQSTKEKWQHQQNKQNNTNDIVSPLQCPLCRIKITSEQFKIMIDNPQESSYYYVKLVIYNLLSSIGCCFSQNDNDDDKGD